jgi:glutamate dehydrogenase (NADP+)
MPCTTEAMEIFRKSKILVGPGKAANVGGVAVAGYEVVQNNSRIQWTPEEVDMKLQEIMKDIYHKSIKAANDYGFSKGNPQALVHGANIAGFLRVAQAMLEQGCV